jgi:hypothetical protein
VNLFTTEFYELALKALADDGLLCQWLPLAEMNEHEMRIMVAAFTAVFPETSLWREGRGLAPPLLLIGSKHPLTIDVEALTRRMADGAVHADLERLGMATPEGLFELFVAGPEGTRRWVAGAAPITDDRTVVDYTTPRALYSGFGFGYFRLAGEDLKEMQRHVFDVAALYQRLREPVTPLLKDGGRRTTIGMDGAGASGGTGR